MTNEAKIEVVDDWDEHEKYRNKLIASTKRNPLVPIGLVATIAALTVGLYTMKSGNQKLGQKMMRARVTAQTFTVFALIGGVLFSAYKAGPYEAPKK